MYIHITTRLGEMSISDSSLLWAQLVFSHARHRAQPSPVRGWMRCGNFAANFASSSALGGA